MTPINSLDSLIFTVLGALIGWAGTLLKKWWKTSTTARREKADAHARTDRRNRLLTESLFEHRTVMLKSGHWTRDTLPPFIKDPKE